MTGVGDDVQVKTKVVLLSHGHVVANHLNSCSGVRHARYSYERKTY